MQIRTWSAQLRMATTVDFPWKEDIWYRMKFRVDIESEPPAAVALLRGKVWPRDEDEPKEWTITARDESPNLAASPGLYGNAKVAELYLDNIEVTEEFGRAIGRIEGRKLIPLPNPILTTPTTTFCYLSTNHA